MATENQDQTQGNQDQTQENQDKPEVISRDEVQALVNSALASHTKRLEGRFDKSLGELKTLLTQQQAAPKPDAETEDAKSKGDSKSKMLEQQLADLRRQMEEEKALRKRTEDEARRNTTRNQLRQHLEAANVRKELLDMVVNHWEATGVLKYDEEGKPLVSVKRSRTKNAPEEEMTFDDLKSGVDDFVKSPTAAVLLKPPPNAAQQTQAGVARASGPVRTYAHQAQSDEEIAARVAEQLGDQLYVNR